MRQLAKPRLASSASLHHIQRHLLAERQHTQPAFVIPADSLVAQQNIHLVQVQSSMHGNPKRVCEIFEEAQGIINQLKFIDKDYKRYAIMKGLLNDPDKPSGDWGKTTNTLAAIIRQLDRSAPHSCWKQLQSGEGGCCKTILPALLQACQYFPQLCRRMLPQTSPY